jgi:RNA polymerase sigma-54 factor
MGLELKQSMRLTQSLVMTPQLQQAIKLLQLSRLELVDEIRKEMEQNPLLEEPSDDAGAELGETPVEHGPAMLDEMGESEQLQAPSRDSEPDTKQAADGDVERSDIDWEQYLDNYQTQHTTPSGSAASAGEDMPTLESTLTREWGLTEHLMEQLRIEPGTDDEKLFGAQIIGNLDQDGYLVVDPEELLPVEPELLESAEPGAEFAGELAGLEPLLAEVRPPAIGDLHTELAAVQGLTRELSSQLKGRVSEALQNAKSALAEVKAATRESKKKGPEADPLILLALKAGVSAALADRVHKRILRYQPAGCGARDLRECLLAQAHYFATEGDGRDDPNADLLHSILRKHLKNVEMKRYPAIAKDLHVSLEEVKVAIRLLERLEPKPGRLYTAEEPRYITPDVYILKIGDGYIIQLNDDGLSKLRISTQYRQALKTGATGNNKAKEYIQDKLRSAQWLIRSIHQRQRTIVKVCESIIKFQRDFLDRGIAHLRPLILRDVAEDIGMHESTVSRVTTNKYVHTPQGIYELKFFFNSSISRVGGEDIASQAVKDQIRQIIAKEPPEKPYSDQRIVELLREQNVDIARRTVAKYREVLGILPSSRRKRYE